MSQTIDKQQKPFEYEWSRPCSDWFEMVKVKLNRGDYIYYRIERRFGPSWWLIGMNTKDTPKYHWADTQIGEINEYDLKRFIEWAKNPDGRGSKIIQFKAICGSFDILGEVSKLDINYQQRYEALITAIQDGYRDNGDARSLVEWIASTCPFSEDAMDELLTPSSPPSESTKRLMLEDDSND